MAIPVRSPLPKHDARIPHVLGENTASELLVLFPRDPAGEFEITGVIIDGTVIVDLATALDADGQPDALLRMERRVRSFNFGAQS